ncbi:MAG: ferritin-like domain-containing protein [Oscillospiraceae bacterium]|nr:ferritin-like domain-containing protein [Oscillospiraceae bacterium]
MENTMFSGQTPSPAYDYRVYDQVWQRVAPGTDPFSPDPAAAGMTESPQAMNPIPPVNPAPAAPAASAPAPRQENGGEGNIPGAESNPCCMGTEARESLEVLEGFLQEELAEARCCQSLACRTRNRQAARLLCQTAAEKRTAARELCAAYYLITGKQYAPAITVEHLHWESLPQALRSCYHQEACNGLNYQRASDESLDPCLQKLFARLADQSYQRAEKVMALLGNLIC